jgi:hypothetical protein
MDLVNVPLSRTNDSCHKGPLEDEVFGASFEEGEV